ncbi:hypothetical protein [Providencia rustigianii]|uniref:hypothetical protein n=1 Tax=Providencia rustigianii TaxID=158850 RepID=UPI00223F1AD2|nr:hypothetical protein [Providencia rustigianii]
MESEILHHWMVSLFSNQDGQMQYHYRTYATTKHLCNGALLNKAIKDLGISNSTILSVCYLGSGTFDEFNGDISEANKNSNEI